MAGDGHVVTLSWDSSGKQVSKIIHQYGSATQDETSPHYDDQVKLFADEEMKPTFFDKNQLRKNTKSILTIPLQEVSQY